MLSYQSSSSMKGSMGTLTFKYTFLKPISSSESLISVPFLTFGGALKKNSLSDWTLRRTHRYGRKTCQSQQAAMSCFLWSRELVWFLPPIPVERALGHISRVSLRHPRSRRLPWSLRTSPRPPATRKHRDGASLQPFCRPSWFCLNRPPCWCPIRGSNTLALHVPPRSGMCRISEITWDDEHVPYRGNCTFLSYHLSCLHLDLLGRRRFDLGYA